MYLYYIRDDTSGLYLIGHMKLGAPVHTCVYGNRREDATTFSSAIEARQEARRIGGDVSAYRYNTSGGAEIRLKSGAEDRGRLA